MQSQPRTVAAPSVILVAVQRSHWGACRFGAAFRKAGFRVSVLARKGSLVYAARDRDDYVRLWAMRFVPLMRFGLERALRRAPGSRIVATDERAFAFLGRLVADEQKRPGSISTELRDAIGQSVGDITTMPVRGHKTALQDLARRIGVAVPPGLVPVSAEDAAHHAAKIGYPVLLKQPTGAGGGGVSLCFDEAKLRQAYDRFTKQPSTIKRWRRAILRRDWYVSTPEVYLQKFIAGTTGITCAYAERGEMLGVLSALSLAQRAPTRPCTAIRLVRHPAMEAATEKMIAALGVSGFVSFDFIIDPVTGEPLLLECNPRPIQMMPLGPRVGADLCRTMHEVMVGTLPRYLSSAEGEESVALFPQEWQRQQDSPLLSALHHDVPWHDPVLLQTMLRRATRHSGRMRRDEDDLGAVDAAAEPMAAPLVEVNDGLVPERAAAE